MNTSNEAINVQRGDYLTISRNTGELGTVRVLHFSEQKIQGVMDGKRVSIDFHLAQITEQPDTRPLIVLLACSKTKANRESYALDMYRGTLFLLAYQYSTRVLDADRVFILSAKHGALSRWSIIHPYDFSMDRMTHDERESWGHVAWQQMHTNLYKTWGLQPEQFRWVILAGKLYREPLRPLFEQYDITPETPLAGLGIGAQQQRLKAAIEHNMALSDLYSE